MFVFPGSETTAEANQQQKIISLLETAHMLAVYLDERALSYYIERALDEARTISLFGRTLSRRAGLSGF